MYSRELSGVLLLTTRAEGASAVWSCRDRKAGKFILTVMSWNKHNYLRHFATECGGGEQNRACKIVLNTKINNKFSRNSQPTSDRADIFCTR